MQLTYLPLVEVYTHNFLGGDYTHIFPRWKEISLELFLYKISLRQNLPEEVNEIFVVFSVDFLMLFLALLNNGKIFLFTTIRSIESVLLC